MNVAFIGCGYVADIYARTLANYAELELAVVHDKNPQRAEAFSKMYDVPIASTLDAVLDDSRIDMVVNLTNPSSHYEISKRALEAKKHVYSEKPLSTDFEQAVKLVDLARRQGKLIAGAPCTHLGEAAQTIGKALREGRIGKPRLVYAELDDGPIHLLDYKNWRSESGAPWPYLDEFNVGCTLEHAGYYVSLLVAFFGPAKSVTSFASLVVDDKGIAETPTTPDFSVGCIEFASGVVARLTCSIYAPHDHALRVFGDEGILALKECWDFGSSIGFYPRNRVALKAEKHLAIAHRIGVGMLPVPLVRKVDFGFKVKGANRMDMARGIAEVAEAVTHNRPCRISADFSLHVNEIVLSLQNPKAMGVQRKLVSTCDRPSPTDWAG